MSTLAGWILLVVAAASWREAVRSLALGEGFHNAGYQIPARATRNLIDAAAEYGVRL